MGRAARPLHDPGNHGSVERGSNLQAARRGGLIKPAKPAGERENTAALTPSLGARPIANITDDASWSSDNMWRYFERCTDAHGYGWLTTESAGVATLLS